MGRIQFSEIEASGILTPQKRGSISGVSEFSINPYMGCAFGCSYCYVREMQYGDDADEKSATWGDWVKIKTNAVALLQRSCKRAYGKKIFFGSATDPYQPIERKLGLTRALLECLTLAYPDHVHIQTRSPLVVRDIDVFLRFGDAISIGLSIPTDNDDVRKVFEPSAPSIPQRLAAMSRLHDAGVRVVASFSPLLPCDPRRLGELTRGIADSFWTDSMNYHERDREMLARYRQNGWTAWLKPDLDHVRATIHTAWRGDTAADSPSL